MATKDISVKIGQEEMGQIWNLKENLDYHGQVWEAISRYQALGWEPAVITPQGANLGLDLSQPREVCWQQIADLGLEKVQLNLAIRTGRPSRLLVLEVNRGEGTLSLDLLGDWRSRCVAELGNCREQHYYALPREGLTPGSYFQARGVLIYGDEGLVLTAPSIEPELREPWRWLTPPWESPPQAPKPAVWQFLREYLGLVGPPQEIPSWEEIYRLISGCGGVLQALLAPALVMDDYYRDILMATRAAGLRDRRVLLGLLWHAPSGDASNNPERWQSLQKLLADLESQSAAWSSAPEPATATGPAMEAQGLTLSGGKPGETTARVEKSLSGDFFQLLAGLVDRLVAESSRQDVIKTGVRAQPPELDRLITEIEKWLAFPAVRTGWPKIDSASAGGCNLGDLSWTEAMTPRSWEMQEAKALVQDFLSNNPDLTAELGKIQMVLFSLKNYISINPEYAGLPFPDKLVKAGQMARDFLDK